jgi:hypothetical protein
MINILIAAIIQNTIENAARLLFLLTSRDKVSDGIPKND